MNNRKRPTSKKLPTKKAENQIVPRRPSRQPQEMKLPKLISPGAHDVMLYAAALADPWNAPYTVGIPMGGVGLPTFKTTVYRTTMVDTMPATAPTARDGVSWRTGAHVAFCAVELFGDGRLRCRAGSAASEANIPFLYEETTVNPRIVAASIRVTQMGRREDNGMQTFVRRNCYDGEESSATFTQSGMAQANYIPKSNWDLDYKLNVAGHPTNFNAGMTVGIQTLVPSALKVEFIVILESNDDTPVPSVYDLGKYVMTVPSITQSSPTLVPNKLGQITEYASRGTVIPYHESHGDPMARTTPRFLDTVDNVAKTAGSWMDGAAAVGRTLGNVWNTITKAASFIPLIL